MFTLISAWISHYKSYPFPNCNSCTCTMSVSCISDFTAISGSTNPQNWPAQQVLLNFFVVVVVVVVVGGGPPGWPRSLASCMIWRFVRGIYRSLVNSTHIGQWRGALMFSLFCAWTKFWVNNRDAGDLRRHRAHYDLTVVVLLSRTSSTVYDSGPNRLAKHSLLSRELSIKWHRWEHPQQDVHSSWR